MSQAVPQAPETDPDIPDRPDHPEPYRRGTSQIALAVASHLGEVILCVLLATAVVAMLGLVTRHFFVVPTTVIGLVLGLLTAGWLGLFNGGSASAACASLTMALLAVTLSVPNLLSSSQWLYSERDPATYTITAKWLTEHSAPVISQGLAAFGRTVNSEFVAGFYLRDGDDTWYPQASHLLPALISIPGSLGGRALLAGNVVIGVCALLALYTAARQILGHWWALLPSAVVGLSMPFMAFTRGIYTEPTAMAFAFFAAAMLVRGCKKQSVKPWVVAGCAAGAVAMVRIDGLLVTAPLVMALGIVCVTNPVPVRGLRALTVFLGPALLLVGLGAFELIENSTEYLLDLRSQIIGVVAVLVFGVAVYAITTAIGTRSRSGSWGASAIRHWAIAASIGVLALGVLLSARPLFWQAHHVDASSGYGTVVATLQRIAGQPVSPSRSYDEQSVVWVVWYLGIVGAVLALFGLALMTYRLVLRRDAGEITLACLIGSVCLVYLTYVAITPEQIWATRRFLPVIIPGLAMAAIYPLRALAARRTRWASVVSLAGVIGCLALPFRTSAPLVATPEIAGWSAQVNNTCDRVSGGRLLIADEGLYETLAVTLRVWCDVPVGFLATGTDLASARLADPSRPLYVLGITADEMRGGGAVADTFSTTTTRWERTLDRPPVSTVSATIQFFVAQVDDQNVVTSVGASR